MRRAALCEQIQVLQDTICTIALHSYLSLPVVQPQPPPLNILHQPMTRILTRLNIGFGVCSKPLSTLPSFSDCQQAILRRLSYHLGKATFHSTLPNDAFKLPSNKQWDDCSITVILVGGAGVTEEVSSWSEIRYAGVEVK